MRHRDWSQEPHVGWGHRARSTGLSDHVLVNPLKLCRQIVLVTAAVDSVTGAAPADTLVTPSGALPGPVIEVLVFTHPI